MLECLRQKRKLLRYLEFGQPEVQTIFAKSELATTLRSFSLAFVHFDFDDKRIKHKHNDAHLTFRGNN